MEKGEVVQPGSLKIVHTMGLPQRFSGHIKGHLYIVMDVKLPLSGSLSDPHIAMFKQILPNTQIDDENSDGDEESKTQSNGHSNNKPQQKKKNNNKQKNNKRHKNNKRNNKKKNNKKNKGKKEKGMFGGLHGAFGGGNANGNNKQQQQQQFDDASDSDDLIEECECHSVDGNPKATPAAARNAYTQEDDDEQENVQCRQM